MLTPERKHMATSPPTPTPPEAVPGKPRRSWFIALLKLRCPRCREGRMFKSLVRMNDPCPVCGLVFEREPGYFLGAMYVSYALAVMILAPLFFLAQWLFPRMDYLLV